MQVNRAVACKFNSVGTIATIITSKMDSTCILPMMLYQFQRTLQRISYQFNGATEILGLGSWAGETQDMG